MSYRVRLERKPDRAGGLLCIDLGRLTLREAVAEAQALASRYPGASAFVFHKDVALAAYRMSAGGRVEDVLDILSLNP